VRACTSALAAQPLRPLPDQRFVRQLAEAEGGGVKKKRRKKAPAKAPGGIRIIDEDSTGFHAVGAQVEADAEEEEEGANHSLTVKKAAT
jgi:hypothetical protein